MIIMYVTVLYSPSPPWVWKWRLIWRGTVIHARNEEKHVWSCAICFKLLVTGDLKFDVLCSSM
jgi:hypothetical protein